MAEEKRNFVASAHKKRREVGGEKAREDGVSREKRESIRKGVMP